MINHMHTNPITYPPFVMDELITQSESDVHQYLKRLHERSLFWRFPEVLKETARAARDRFDGQRADFLQRYIDLFHPSEHESTATKQLNFFRSDL